MEVTNSSQGMQRIRENNTRREMTRVSGVEQIRKEDVSNLGVIYMGELRKGCVGSHLEMVHEEMTEFQHKESQA